MIEEVKSAEGSIKENLTLVLFWGSFAEELGTRLKGDVFVFPVVTHLISTSVKYFVHSLCFSPLEQRNSVKSKDAWIMELWADAGCFIFHVHVCWWQCSIEFGSRLIWICITENCNIYFSRVNAIKWTKCRHLSFLLIQSTFKAIEYQFEICLIICPIKVFLIIICSDLILIIKCLFSNILIINLQSIPPS